jgi:hypothetical protein
MTINTLPAIFIGYGSSMNILADSTFTRDMIMLRKQLRETIVLDVSEFRQVDGELSCLSLRF